MRLFCLVLLACTVHLSAGKASSFVGSTSTAVFPPPNATFTSTLFPDANQIGFAGPTPTGDEADSIATAPAIAKLDNVYPLIKPDTFDKKEDFDVLQQWGNLAPWQSVKSFGLPKASPQIPPQCKLNQVHLVHRHGARYPTSGSSPAVFAAALHEAAISPAGVSFTGPLQFLNTWTYKLGAEILVPFGRGQVFNLGMGFRVKYGDLLKGFSGFPVFRTTSEARMVDSALHFAAGFFGVQTYQSDYYQLIEVEASGFNSTLAPYDICSNSNNEIGGFGTVQANKWADIYLAPAVTRLSPFTTFPVNTTALLAMQTICAYETNALGYSAFCDLFTEDEWEGFEYWNDLQFWYSNGPGNPTTSALGIGYVQELVSRLTQTRITDFNSAVNETIVKSNLTFPLNQPMYVDATHDTVIASIITAMNFTSLAANGPLPTDHIPINRTYRVNQLAPFGSNLVGQVLSCDGAKQPSHIRWILNDGVMPLTGIQGCEKSSLGLCSLPAFIEGMKTRIKQVDFAFDCFANYTIPIPDTIIDGQFPQTR